MKTKLTVPDLIQALPGQDRDHAVMWWGKLSAADRLDFETSWEESLEKDSGGLVLIGFDADRGYIFKGTYREGDDVDAVEFSDDELFDFYAGLAGFETHPFINFRVGGVCMAHAAAKACLEQGLIPKGFQCPLSHEHCPMKSILSLSGQRSVRLRLLASA